MRKNGGCFLNLRSDEHRKFKLVMVVISQSGRVFYSFIQSVNICENLLCSWHYAMAKSLNFLIFNGHSNKRVILKQQTKDLVI